MKNFTYLLFATLLLSGCGSKKSLETIAPFSLGEAYGQKWDVEDRPAAQGYEVVITILSLTEDEAVLKNLYHQGKMAPVQIKLKDIGTVAVAEFGAMSSSNDTTKTLSPKVGENEFPFELTETQAVISYVQNKKVRYYRIDGIQRNLPVSYPTASAKMRQ